MLIKIVMGQKYIPLARDNFKIINNKMWKN